jgi:opacity protein-like surface antigen
MKINKLHLLIIFLISNVTFAQSNYKFGIEAGPSYKSYRGTDIFENTTNKLGYLLGLTVEYKLNDKFSIKSGFRYEKNRIDYDSDYTTYWIRTDDYGQELLTLPIVTPF